MATAEKGKEPEKTKPASKKADEERARVLRWGVVSLAVLVALIAWLTTQAGEDEGGAPEVTAGFEAKIVDESELVEIADAAGHDVYWAGPIEGTELEASESEEGNVQVRYLEAGAEPGSDPAGTLTIGTYPLADANGAVAGFAEREGAIVREGSDGTEVVTSTSAPSSVYFASPDGGLQVEVYDPSPARAMGLALSGDVQPVG